MSRGARSSSSCSVPTSPPAKRNASPAAAVATAKAAARNRTRRSALPRNRAPERTPAAATRPLTQGPSSRIAATWTDDASRNCPAPTGSRSRSRSESSNSSTTIAVTRRSASAVRGASPSFHAPAVTTAKPRRIVPRTRRDGRIPWLSAAGTVPLSRRPSGRHRP